MIKQISSIQNPFIKDLTQLKEKSRQRRKQGLFLIEGAREIQLALECGYTINHLLIEPDIANTEPLESIRAMVAEDVVHIELSSNVYKKLALRDSTEGLLAVARFKEHTLENLELSENPVILVAEAPEKPGNIGALLRTADAAGIDAVCIANPRTDIYNPNIIRSSVGCVFTTQIAQGSSEEIIAFLKKKNIKLYCAALSASSEYHRTDFTKPCAVIVGTEATGLSEQWLIQSDQNIIIPMRGKIDSMNVSVSAAILIFEAIRQRLITK